jgi:hypothetical protein
LASEKKKDAPSNPITKYPPLAEVSSMTARHLLMLCFVLAAYGADLVPPLETFSASSSKAPTNVSTYLTQPTAKAIVDLTGFADRSVSPGRSRSYLQGNIIRLATTPRSPPLLTNSIADVLTDVQTDPNLFTDHADPAPATRSSHDKPVLAGNFFRPPVSHGPDTSDMKDFMKRRTCSTGDDGPKKDAKPKMLTRIWIIVTKKHAPANLFYMCGNGAELFYTMTRTCIAPTYHSDIPPSPPPPPPLSFCCELLYVVTLILISMSLVVSTACAFGFHKRFNKLAGLKIPCRELLFVFLTLFPAPAAAATQGMVDQSAIQVAVYTNASTPTNVTSWVQLVTACAASAKITLSPAFQMGAYTNEIDFRLVAFIYIF